MKERIYENGIEYILVSDYYFPNIVEPHKERHIGKYDMLHRDYIKEHYPWFYARFKEKVNYTFIDMRGGFYDDILPIDNSLFILAKKFILKTKQKHSN